MGTLHAIRQLGIPSPGRKVYLTDGCKLNWPQRSERPVRTMPPNSPARYATFGFMHVRGRNGGNAAYSTPLVLGTPVIRGSASRAIRKARAADLKMPSAM